MDKVLIWENLLAQAKEISENNLEIKEVSDFFLLLAIERLIGNEIFAKTGERIESGNNRLNKAFIEKIDATEGIFANKTLKELQEIEAIVKLKIEAIEAIEARQIQQINQIERHTTMSPQKRIWVIAK